MLKLKVLRGIEKKIFELREGVNVVGRADNCDIVIPSTGVSKRHAQLLVKDNVCSVTDLGSSNGTFVNGVKVQDRILKSGDRIGFNDVIVELRAESSPVSHVDSIPFAPAFDGSVAPNLRQQEQPATKPQNLMELFSYYFENIVMPGVYKINEVYPTKNIVAAFILIFAVAVTMLSTIPMSEMMKESIQKEAQRRALTIANQLAEASERAITLSGEATIRTDFAESEDGVTAAMVVAKEDGHIIAPLSKSQSYSNEEFVARARKQDGKFVDQTTPTTIGASVPVRMYSPETGQQLNVAYAIVLYKMTTLDWSATVGLFARVLLISLLVGFFIFLFIYKIVTEPIRQTSRQLDKALRGEINIIETKYIFGTFNYLVNNVNSALARIGSPTDQQVPIFDRHIEGANIIRIIHDGAICLSHDAKILSVNQQFEEITNQRLLSLQGQNLNSLQDQALHLNLEDLFQKAISSPQQIHSSQLEISGVLYDLDSQAVTDGKEVSFVVMTVKRRVEG